MTAAMAIIWCVCWWICTMPGQEVTSRVPGDRAGSGVVTGAWLPWLRPFCCPVEKPWVINILDMRSVIDILDTAGSGAGRACAGSARGGE